MAGSALIGALRASLGLDSAQFHTGAKQAQSTLRGLLVSFKAFAVGAVAALSFGAVTKVLKSAANKADELGKAAQKIGIPVEELSKLEYAARLADVGLEQLSTGVGKLSKNMSAIAAGKGGDAGAALRAIGVSATTATGQLRPTIDVVRDVAEKFAAMKDGAGKTAIAMAIFGKSGAELIPLLNSGRAGLAAAADEAERLGIVISSQAAQAAEGFNDNLTRLKAAGEGFSTQITIGILPALNQLTDALVGFSQEGTLAQNTVTALNAILDYTRGFLLALSGAWAEITRWISAAGEAMQAMGSGDFSGSLAAFTKASADLDAMWVDIRAQIEGTAQAVNRVGKGSREAVQTEAPVLQLKELATQVKAVGTAGQASASQVKSGFQNIGASAQTLGQQISQTLGSSFQNWIGQALDGTFKLKDALKDLLSQVSKMALNSFLQKLMGGLGGTGGAGGGMFAGIGKLFGFAQGGSFKVGGSGGIDSQVVAFRASPEERVTITKPGQDMGPVSGQAESGNRTSIVFNISTPDVAGFRRSQGQLAAMLTRTAAMGQRNL